MRGTFWGLAEINVNVPGLLATQYGDTIPFAIHSDPAPAIYINGNPAPSSATACTMEHEVGLLGVANPLTSGTDQIGRACQAVVLSREDVSPLQVAAADALLREGPLGDERLFTEMDPCAAAVAAAHWLQAAADADSVYVVAQADDIEALPHETLTVVLESMSRGVSPRETVTVLSVMHCWWPRGWCPTPGDWCRRSRTPWYTK